MITWRWCFILIKWCKMIQDDERSGTSWWNPTDACGTELMIHGNGSHSRYLSGPIKSWSFESFGLSSYIKLSCCFKLLTRKKKQSVLLFRLWTWIMPSWQRAKTGCCWQAMALTRGMPLTCLVIYNWVSACEERERVARPRLEMIEPE